MKDGVLHEVVYDAGPQLRRPGDFFARARRDFGAAISLSGNMFRSSLRARYRQSILGYFWLLLTPGAIAGVWIFLNQTGALKFPDTGIPYAVHVTTGVFLWTMFLRMLNSPLQQLQSSRRLLSKMNLPWESIVLAGWLEAAVEALVFILVLTVVNLMFGLNPLLILASFPLIAVLMLVGAAIGILLAPFGMLYEDVPRAIALAVYVLFFLTPVVYPVPLARPGVLAVMANPVAVVLVSARQTMTGQEVTFPGLAAAAAAGSLLLMVVAWIFFRLAVPHMVSKL